MNKDWKEIRSWNVGTSDGAVEKYTLSRNNKNGGFKVQNDFGNVVIDMETMSGIEFFKKVLDEMEYHVTSDCEWLDNIFDSDEDEDTDLNNCDYTD